MYEVFHLGNVLQSWKFPPQSVALSGTESSFIEVSGALGQAGIPH